MTALLIVLAPFVILHLLSWTPLPDKVPVRRKDLGGKNGGRVMGRSSLFWVWAHPQADSATIAHERQHVRDKWRLMWLGYLLFGMTKRGKEWREARGYAVSVKNGRPLDDAARGMAVGIKIGFERAKRLIEEELK